MCEMCSINMISVIPAPCGQDMRCQTRVGISPMLSVGSGPILAHYVIFSRIFFSESNISFNRIWKYFRNKANLLFSRMWNVVIAIIPCSMRVLRLIWSRCLAPILKWKNRGGSHYGLTDFTPKTASSFLGLKLVKIGKKNLFPFIVCFPRSARFNGSGLVGVLSPSA